MSISTLPRLGKRLLLAVFVFVLLPCYVTVAQSGNRFSSQSNSAADVEAREAYLRLMAAKTVKFDDFKSVFGWLTESAGKEKWRKIQWRHDLWDARIEAAKTGKPIFIWAMNGDPLGCVWNNGVAGRVSVFSDDTIIETLNKNFIPVVDNVSKSQVRQDAHGEFFRKIAEQGHYRGRTIPTDTRQGLYTATADGKLLVSVNSTQVGRVQRLLGDAMRRWKTTTAAERSPKFKDSVATDPKFTQIPPKDGLILRMIARDLPRAPKAKRTNLTQQNIDHVWIHKEDMLAMIPRPFDPEEVKLDSIGLRVVKVSQETIKFVVYGRSSAAKPPSRETNPFTGFRIDKEMGIDLVWSGAVVFDRKQQKFTRFDLLAAGERWGGCVYNFRDNDMGRSPIGFAFQVIKNVADDPTPPRFYAYY